MDKLRKIAIVVVIVSLGNGLGDESRFKPADLECALRYKIISISRAVMLKIISLLNSPKMFFNKCMFTS